MPAFSSLLLLRSAGCLNFHDAGHVCFIYSNVFGKLCLRHGNQIPKLRIADDLEYSEKISSIEIILIDCAK